MPCLTPAGLGRMAVASHWWKRISMVNPRFRDPGGTRLILALMVIVLGGDIVPQAGAQSAAANLYNQANALYHSGQFEAARVGYLQVVDSGVEDARVFYNLGNACFKSGELGQAILWYERARRMDPRDEDIQANLRFANTVKKDRNPQAENVVWRFLVEVFFYPTLDELSVSFCLLLSCCFGLAVRRLWSRFPASAGWLVLMALAAGLVVLNGAYLGARIYHQERVVEAVVVAAQGTARSGPDEGQAEVFIVHQGTKVQIARREGEWFLVRLTNGLGGWLPADVVEVI